MHILKMSAQTLCSVLSVTTTFVSKIYKMCWLTQSFAGLLAVKGVHVSCRWSETRTKQQIIQGLQWWDYCWMSWNSDIIAWKWLAEEELHQEESSRYHVVNPPWLNRVRIPWNVAFTTRETGQLSLSQKAQICM